MGNIAITMILQVHSRSTTGNIIPLEEIWNALEPLFLLAVVLVVWYLSQLLLAPVLIRESKAFCPKCFGAYILPSRHRGWECLGLFLPLYSCRECGKRFFLGRKPPFVICPVCRSPKLQTIPSGTVLGRLRKIIRTLHGAHVYICRRCEFQFFDSRPLRANLEETKGNLQTPAA